MRCHLRWRRSRARARLPRSEVWTGAHVAAASSEAQRYASTLWQCGAEEPLLAEVTQEVCTQSCRCQGVPLLRMILPLCLRAPVKVWEVNPKRGCLPSGSGRALQTRTTFPPGPRSRFLDACALHLGEPFSLLGCVFDARRTVSACLGSHLAILCHSIEAREADDIHFCQRRWRSSLPLSPPQA